MKIIHSYFPLFVVLQDNEFFCWQSAEKVCILAALQCDYHPDCPQEEDEDGCGELHVAFTLSIYKHAVEICNVEM